MYDPISVSIVPFGKADFASLVADLNLGRHVWAQDRIKNKPQLEYLSEYLESLGTGTVITEKKYTDRDLLSDHWAFTAEPSFGRHSDCARLHFFKDKLPGGDSSKDTPAVVWEQLRALCGKEGAYLGYVVVLLSSDKIIGKTCLCPRGECPTLATCSVNLLGHPLSVESLGFREQDGVTSACATCALWTVFQSTSKSFGHAALSPGEITARALNILQMGGDLPVSEGLKITDMQRVIRSVSAIRSFVHSNGGALKENEHLEKRLKNAASSNHEEIKDQIKQNNLRCINSTLGFMLPILDSGVPVLVVTKRKVQGTGKERIHAVAVVGYEYDDAASEAARNGDPCEPVTKASKVDILIAHDDNVGPFVRYKVDREQGVIYLLDPDFQKRNRVNLDITAVIGIVHKSAKNYPYGQFVRFVQYYHLFHKTLIDAGQGTHKNYNPVWSTRIWKSNEYKQKLLSSLEEGLAFDHIIRLIKKNLPEYVIVVSAGDCIYKHDSVFSLAGPWTTDAFIDTVPLNADTARFFCTCVRTYEKECSEPQIYIDELGPVLDHILENY